MESQRSLLDSVDECVVLVNSHTNGVIFINKAAKQLDMEAAGVSSFSFEDGGEGGGADDTSSILALKSFTRLDKHIMMKNIFDLEIVKKELEELDDFKSLEEIIKKEAK